MTNEHRDRVPAEDDSPRAASPEGTNIRLHKLHIKDEILSDLTAALALYPRLPGESLTIWYDRVIRDHVKAPEYPLAHALGLAEGADVDMLSEGFEAALGDPTRDTSIADREVGAEHGVASSLAGASTEDFPNGKPDSDWNGGWVTVPVRYNPAHYMATNTYGCIGASRVGVELEAALGEGHTHDSIFQEGLTKIRQLDPNYLRVPVGDLIAWSHEADDFWMAYCKLRDAGVSTGAIFCAGLTVLHPEVTIDEAIDQLVAVLHAPRAFVEGVVRRLSRLHVEPYRVTTDDTELDEEPDGTHCVTLLDAPIEVGRE